MLTKYDPWVNLLRTTVAAFAAGVGGADAVTVLPFDTRLGVPDALGRRMARNISSLLVAESHVLAADDPAGGAHAVEILTAELAEAAWAEFQLIEKAGGAQAALADGSMPGRWARIGAERQRRIASRRQAVTGVSEFPNLREVLPTRVHLDGAAPELFWARPFEDLRDEPAATPVFLATLGSVPEHAARAGFMANLLAAGGIDTVTAGRTGGVADVLAAFRATKTPVVCLTGSDSAYAEIGSDVVKALRAAGAGRVLIAGRPKGELAALVDDQVAVGDDVVQFLRRTRAHLPETELLAPDIPETGANR
jgi:methylmalonyl-CoA mutase